MTFDNGDILYYQVPKVNRVQGCNQFIGVVKTPGTDRHPYKVIWYRNGIHHSTINYENFSPFDGTLVIIGRIDSVYSDFPKVEVVG